MSEAPRAHIPQTAIHSFARASLLVLGALAFLLIVAPQGAHALDLGPAAEQVDRVADKVAQPVGRAVDRVADKVAQPVRRAVDQVVQPVGRAVDQVERAVDQVVQPVGRVVQPVLEPPDQAQVGPFERDPYVDRSQAEVPTPAQRAVPSDRLPDGAREATAPASLPLLTSRASLSQPMGPSNRDFPAGSPIAPAWPSSASMGGSPETGGRGLPLSAAFLAAALALALALSRLLRLLPDARAPNPFLSAVETPG